LDPTREESEELELVGVLTLDREDFALFVDSLKPTVVVVVVVVVVVAAVAVAVGFKMGVYCGGGGTVVRLPPESEMFINSKA
jgi:hypothetical protein